MSYLSQPHYCCKSNSKPETSFSVIKGIKTFSRFREVFLMLSFLWIGIIQANAQQIAVTVARQYQHNTQPVGQLHRFS